MSVVAKGSEVGCGSFIIGLRHDRQFWMFAIYDKDELETLTAEQEKTLKRAIEAELKVRGTL